MTQRFLIRHPDGREYELSDVAYFQAEYEPLGFAIVDPAPTGYTVPEVPKPTKEKAESEPESELQAQKRAELNELASSLGIEKPESFANKDALIGAIQAAQEQGEREPNDDEAEA